MATTFVFAEGFELGSTIAENSLLAKTNWASSAYVNTTSTWTLGASTMGAGRSLQLAIYPNSTTTANYPYWLMPVNFKGTSGAVGYQFSFGWQGKLNPNRTSAAYTPAWGLRNGQNANGGYCMVYAANAVVNGANTLTIYIGTAAVGTFVVPDLAAHYYTFTATKVAANTWNLQMYLDNALVYSNAAVSATFTDLSYFGHFCSGGTVTGQTNIFSELDNMYFREGALMANPYIAKLTPNADVQAQFTRYGSNLTANYQAINKITLDESSGLVGSVGNADVYSISDTLPSGKTLKAVNVTAAGFSGYSETVSATGVIGSGSSKISVASANYANTPFGGGAVTGWEESFAGYDITTFQFGVSRTA